VAWSAKQRLMRVKKIKRRDGSKCWLCGERFNANSEVTIDHAIPKSRGGTNELHNLRLAHGDCNRKRGCITRTPPKALQVRLASLRFPLPVLELTPDMRLEVLAEAA